MAASDVQICNMALGRVGVKTFITDLTEDSTEAIVCNQFYATTRDSLLEEFPWPFASRRAVLGLLSSTRTDWSYVYALPADCIAPRRLVIPGSLAMLNPTTNYATYLLPSNPRAPRSDQRYPYALEASDDGSTQVLLTDVPSAELIYTARIESAGAFPALFADVLAWRVAMEIGYPLSVKMDVLQVAAKGYEVAFARATASAFRQQQEDQAPDSEFTSVRY